MTGNDVQLRHQLCAARAGFEGPRSGGQVVVLYVNDPQFLLDGPVNCRIDGVNDLSVVLRNIILQVDHDQRAVFHLIFLRGFLPPMPGGSVPNACQRQKFLV